MKQSINSVVQEGLSLCETAREAEETALIETGTATADYILLLRLGRIFRSIQSMVGTESEGTLTIPKMHSLTPEFPEVEILPIRLVANQPEPEVKTRYTRTRGLIPYDAGSLAGYTQATLKVLLGYTDKVVVNEDFYKAVRKEAIKRGVWTPEDDKPMHNNRQTRYQNGVRVTLGTLTKFGIIKKDARNNFSITPKTMPYIEEKLAGVKS